MSTEIFASLVQGLETYFKCPLKLDSTGCCLVETASGLKMEFSLDRYREHFCIAARIAEIPLRGKFREDIFKTALESNAMLPQTHGIFAFSPKGNNLILFAKIPIESMTVEKLIPKIELYLANAEKWISALGRGALPSLESKEAKGGVFGLVK